MLTIAKDNLPQSSLSYLAFRVAFLETLERMELAKQFDMSDDRDFGYLTEVPFLKAVPPRVQLDLLLETWRKHITKEHCTANLVDESVVYAACETAANLARDEPHLIRRYLQRGPLPVLVAIDEQLSSELRSLHLNLSNEGDFLLISQFQDLDPDESIRLKTKFGLDAEICEPMFEVLSRWNVSPEFADDADLLLSKQEISRARQMLDLASA